VPTVPSPSPTAVRVAGLGGKLAPRPLLDVAVLGAATTGVLAALHGSRLPSVSELAWQQQ